MKDQELIIRAVREAQLVLASYIEPGPRDAEATINTLLTILDSNGLVAAVDRVEGELGLRSPY